MAKQDTDMAERKGAVDYTKNRIRDRNAANRAAAAAARAGLGLKPKMKPLITLKKRKK